MTIFKADNHILNMRFQSVYLKQLEQITTGVNSSEHPPNKSLNLQHNGLILFWMRGAGVGEGMKPLIP